VYEAERKRRLERRRRRARAQQRQLAVYLFGFIVLFGAYWWFNRDLSPGAPASGVAQQRSALGAVADAMVRSAPRSRVEDLGVLEERRIDRQRAAVVEFARRRVGAEPGDGSLDDLRILQQIVDDRILRRDQTYELQALGVVLGDVMAKQLGLRWVVVDDQYGRTRALRYGTGDDVFFPITMISKRYERGLDVDVRALYSDVEAQVAALRRAASRPGAAQTIP